MFYRLSSSQWPRACTGFLVCALLVACGSGSGNGKASSRASTSAVATSSTSIIGTSSSSSAILEGGSSSQESSNQSSSAQPTNPPPIVNVLFPTAQSLTVHSTLKVRGTAQDLGRGVARVRVNGIDAETTDEFKNWEAAIELEPGDNQIVVEVTDSDANMGSTAHPVQVRYMPIQLDRPLALAIDEEAQIVYASSSYQLMVIDIATGLVSKVFDVVHPEPNKSHSQITDIVFDELNKRVFVGYWDSSAIVAIDVSDGPNQGAQTIVTSNSVPNSTNPIGRLTSLAMDSKRDRLLVADSNFNQVVAVNLNPGASFGERTIVSSGSIPSNSAPAILAPRAIVVDPTTDVAYLVQQSSNYVLEINLAGANQGVRSLIASDEYPSDNIGFDEVQDVAIDLTRKKLLIVNGRDATGFLQYDRIGVIEVDIAPGALKGVKSVLTDEYHPTSTYSFLRPWSVIIDQKNSRAIVADIDLESIFSIQLNGGDDRGELAPLAHSNTPSPALPLGRIQHMSIDSTGEKILISNGRPYGIYGIEKTTGARSLISNHEVAGTSAWPSNTGPLVNDPANNRILVADIENNFWATPKVITINSTTGKGTLVSSNSMPNNLLPLENIKDMVLDTSRNRLIVLDDQTKKIVAVNLNEGPLYGSRSLITDWSVPGEEVDMLEVVSMVLDSEMNRLYLAGSGAGRLFEVNLEPGQDYGKRSVFSGSGSQNMHPYGLAIDLIGKRLFVSTGAGEEVSHGIYAINITDSPSRGSLELVFAIDSSKYKDISLPDFIAWSQTSGLLYGAGKYDRTIYAMDLKTGEWVYLAR